MRKRYPERKRFAARDDDKTLNPKVFITQKNGLFDFTSNDE